MGYFDHWFYEMLIQAVQYAVRTLFYGTHSLQMAGYFN
jgi:hypothetical protein